MELTGALPAAEESPAASAPAAAGAGVMWSAATREMAAGAALEAGAIEVGSSLDRGYPAPPARVEIIRPWPALCTWLAHRSATWAISATEPGARWEPSR